MAYVKLKTKMVHSQLMSLLVRVRACACVRAWCVPYYYAIYGIRITITTTLCKLFSAAYAWVGTEELTAPSHGDGSLLPGSLLVYGSSSSSSSSSQNANSLNKSTQKHTTKIERLSIF